MRRQAQGDFDGSAGAHHVAGGGQRRQPLGTGDGQLGPPGAIEKQFGEVGAHRLHAVHEGEFAVEICAQDSGSGRRLLLALGGDLHVEILGQDLAGLRILQAGEELAHDAEAGGDHAAGVTGMDTLGENVHRQVPGDHATQGGRHPELIVVAAARVQADHQAGGTDAIFQVIDVGRKIGAAAFFAAFDDDDAAAVREVLVLEGLYRGQ